MPIPTTPRRRRPSSRSPRRTPSSPIPRSGRSTTRCVGWVPSSRGDSRVAVGAGRVHRRRAGGVRLQRFRWDGTRGHLLLDLRPRGQEGGAAGGVARDDRGNPVPHGSTGWQGPSGPHGHRGVPRMWRHRGSAGSHSRDVYRVQWAGHGLIWAGRVCRQPAVPALPGTRQDLLGEMRHLCGSWGGAAGAPGDDHGSAGHRYRYQGAPEGPGLARPRECTGGRPPGDLSGPARPVLPARRPGHRLRGANQPGAGAPRHQDQRADGGRKEGRPQGPGRYPAGPQVPNQGRGNRQGWPEGRSIGGDLGAVAGEALARAGGTGEAAGRQRQARLTSWSAPRGAYSRRWYRSTSIRWLARSGSPPGVRRR